MPLLSLYRETSLPCIKVYSIKAIIHKWTKAHREQYTKKVKHVTEEIFYFKHAYV